MPASTLDFIAAWTAYQQQRPSTRLNPAADREFWEQHAARYDERASGPGGAAHTLALLQTLLQPDDTLLDVGAGTGRFALPLAHHVRQITALDQSAAMLARLRHKAEAQGVGNIALHESDWQQAIVAPHDVVLAAWSLYRQLDLREALERLVAATRRTLVIVTAAGVNPPHRAPVEACCGRWTEMDIPSHIYLLGALWQIGVWAEARLVWETRQYEGESPAALAALLAPMDTPEAELQRLGDALAPFCTPHGSGWRYHYNYPVGIIVWTRNESLGL